MDYQFFWRGRELSLFTVGTSGLLTFVIKNRSNRKASYSTVVMCMGYEATLPELESQVCIFLEETGNLISETVSLFVKW